MATRPLPANPNLRSLKNQAKQLLHAHQAGHSDACERIKTSHPRLGDSLIEEIRKADFSLVDAQWVIAREYGFLSWPKLVDALKSPVEDRDLPPIHLTDLDFLPERKQLQEILELRESQKVESAWHSLISRSPEGTFRAARHQQKITFPNQRTFSLMPGENVKWATDRSGFIALCYGYICRQKEQIHILPPLWIDGERMTVNYFFLPQKQFPQYPDLGEIKTLFTFMGIKHGSDDAAIDLLIDRFQVGDPKSLFTPIVRGTQPQLGHDSRFDWAIDVRKEQPGGGLPDAGFKLHREEGPLVNSGDLLGILIGPEQGLDGVDVFGHEVKAPSPHNIEVITNVTVRAEEGDNGQIHFFAESGGGVYVSNQIRVTADRSHTRIAIGIYPIADEMA
jgi:hypothetical protein